MKRKVAVAAGIAATVLLAGCTSSSGESAAGSGESAASSGESESAAPKPATDCTNKIVHADAPTVTVWAWYPNMETVVDNFNAQHSDLQVCWNNPGTDAYDKIQTAVTAGKGLPDVIQVEFDRLPSFVIQDALVNLNDYGADSVKADFNEGAWEDVSVGDAVYAIPVDGGPVGLIYRADVLDKYGLAPPTTWDEFASDAKAIKDAGGPAFSNLTPNLPALMYSLMVQNGATPFTYDPANKTEITIQVDDDASKAVLDYWAGLAADGLVSTTGFGTELVQGLIAGNVGSLPAAAWVPGYLSSAGVGKGAESGQWAAAPLPQWSTSDPVSVNWGGSTFAVTSQATDKQLAANVAMQLYADPESLQDGWSNQIIFPLNKAVLDSPEFIDGEPAFFGGQQVNKEVFVPAAEAYTGTQYAPFQTYFYAQLTDALTKIAEGSLTGAEAADQLQAALVTYAEGQGFTVTE